MIGKLRGIVDAAGADHVAVQLIAEPGTDLDAGFRRLAQILALPAPPA